MANRAQLAIEITADHADAVRGMDDVTSAAKDLAREVARVDDATANTSRSLTNVADASDNMASSSAQAAGGLGDLGGALALMPGPLAGVGGAMESLAAPIMGVTGAMDLLNLAAESNIVISAKAKLAAAGHAVVTGAQAVVTGVATAAQWAFNAAMAANPIGLVILAVVALTAGFIILYKKSDRFRGIVHAVGKAGAAAVGWIVDVVSDLVGWVGDKLPGSWRLAKTLIVGYIKLITLPWRVLFDLVKSLVTWVRDKVPAAFNKAKDKATLIGDTLTAPFRAVRDMIKEVVEWIGKIDIPDLGDLKDLVSHIPGFGRAAPSTSLDVATTDQFAAARTADTYNINITGAVDPESTARQITKLVNDSRRRRGLPAVL